MKLTAFFISRTRQIYAKTLTVSESTIKMKAMSTLIVFEVLVTSTVACKLRLLHKNEVVQYLQNHKYQAINRNYFRKHLKASINTLKNNYPKTGHTFFMGKINQTTFFRNYTLTSQNRLKLTLMWHPSKT